MLNKDIKIIKGFLLVSLLAFVNAFGYFALPKIQEAVNSHNGIQDFIVIIYFVIGITCVTFAFSQLRRKEFINALLLLVVTASSFYWLYTLNGLQCNVCSHV